MLIKCPECGNDVSDLAEQCIHCGFPLKKRGTGNNRTGQNNCDNQSRDTSRQSGIRKCIVCGDEVGEGQFFCERCKRDPNGKNHDDREYFDAPEYKESFWKKTGRFLCDIFLGLSNNTCARCNSHNINMTYETTGEVHTGRIETRKKSIVTRVGNKAGRAGMIMATGGLWALTPKKSKYHDVYKEKVRYEQRKVYTCMDCGYVWYE